MIKIIAIAALIGCVAANTQQTFETYQQPSQPVPLQPRTGFGANVGGGFQDGGFGVNGGFNTPLGGFNGDVGVRAPSFINNNLLTGLIVFLGVLSFINIIATVVTPWLNNIGGDDEEEKSIDTEKGRMYQRQINTMADYVLNGIESFAQKNQ